MSDRFVILHHRTPDGEHWDLMLERGEVLATWQLLADPDKLCAPAATPIPARQIGDHRKAYLDYEGPLTGGRGHVRRTEEGIVNIVDRSTDRIVLQLRGRRLQGMFQLVRQGGTWSFLTVTTSDPN